MANALAKIEVAGEHALPGFAPKSQNAYIDGRWVPVADVKTVFNQGDWINSGAPGNIYSSHRLYDTSPGSAVNYAALAGDFWTNSACQAVLNWIICAWPESYPCVKEPGEGGKKLVVAHPLADILMDPNPWDDDTTLWGATILSFWCDGNAYWRINRDRGGRVREFEYVPHWAMTPFREPGSTNPGPDFYRMGTVKGPIDLNPWDVVHFRWGKDPYADLYGLSPWQSACREVYTDNEGCNFTATTLRNRGTAWMIVSPAGADGEFEDPNTVRDLIEARTTGDNRGRVVVLTGAARVDMPGGMKDMGVESLRNIPVHRICALAGISVDSIDLGDAGDHVTFQNQKAADAKSWNRLVSVQRMLGRQLTKQVLWNPRNYGVPRNTLFIGFDYSEVRALQSQKFEEWDAVAKIVKAGVITRDEGREEMGYDAMTEAQKADVLEYERSLMPAPPVVTAKPVAAPAGNGTGKHAPEVLLNGVAA